MSQQSSAMDSVDPKSFSVPCPAGNAIGGGAVVSGAGGGAPPAGVSLFRSEPTLIVDGLPTGWAGGAHESVLTVDSWSLTVFVLCATVS